jgi:exodeoxyribonuclease X
MVEQCNSFRDYLKGPNPLEGLVSEDYLMVAHNAFYDDKVIERYGVKFRRTLCTLAIAKKLFKDDTSVVALNLPYLRYRFEILDPADETVANAHRADADALVTYHLLSVMITMMEEQGIIDTNKDYYSQITAWLKQPTIIEVMPFGKHKGKKLSEIPNSYWTWAFENMDTFDENSDKYDEDFTNSVLAAINLKLG